MPREIRQGRSEMVLQPVERSVSPDEVATAVRALVAEAPVCVRWPALWLEGDSRSTFSARFDMMARDWGADVAAEAEQRMDDFVAMGFLTKGAERSEYTLTETGRVLLRGSPYNRGRPSFCGSAQRELVEIVAMEWGAFDCGSLNVRFTHTAEHWPSWAQTERARAYLAETWPTPGSIADGSVSLSRQWFAQTDTRAGPQPNGQLRSVCYDSARREVYGNGNLNLHVAPHPTDQ